jgi:hypothetical protein
VNGGDPPAVNLRRAAIISARDIPLQTSQKEADRANGQSDNSIQVVSSCCSQTEGEEHPDSSEEGGNRDEKRRRERSRKRIRLVT